MRKNTNLCKQDIVRKIVGQTGIETTDVDLIVMAFLKTVRAEVSNGKRVEFRGFGSFAPKTKKAKIARDIARGIPVHLPERKVPSFKPSNKYFTIKPGAECTT